MIKRHLMVFMLLSNFFAEAHADNFAEAPRLTATEFAAVASEMRQSPKILEVNVEECLNHAMAKTPAQLKPELAAMMKSQCSRFMRDISSGFISFERYKILWDSGARGIVKNLD